MLKNILKFGAIIVGVVVIFFIGVTVGATGTKVNLDGKKMNARELEGRIDRLQTNLEEQKTKNKEVYAMIKDKDKIKSELSDSKKELDTAQDELDKVKSNLDSKKDELAMVTGQVEKAKGQPKTLQAGQYIVGKDIPAGRYKATPVGEGSNFFLYDESGEAIVNTILGEQPSYTFEASDGNVIQSECVVKLTPIE